MVVRDPLARRRVLPTDLTERLEGGVVQRGKGGRVRRVTVAAALAATAVTGWAVFGGGAGRALAEGEASALVEATNASRQRLAGAEPLARAADLDAVAQRHAEAMAARGGLFHNAELASQVEGWRIVAENVGVGMDIGRIHQAFLDSPSHRANVLDARLTQLGVGIVVAGEGDGRIWVVEVFRTPMAAASAPPASTAAPAPATAPSAVGPPAQLRRPSGPAPAAPTSDAAARAAAEADAARIAAEAEAAGVAAEADAARIAAEAEAARVAAEVAAVAEAIDLTAPASYVPSPEATELSLSSTTLVSSTTPAGAPNRPAVALAGGLWLVVAASLLRRVRSDVTQTARQVRRVVLRPAASA